MTEKEKSKMGRPTDNPKNYKFQIRLGEEDWEKLKTIETKTNKSRSEIVREGIRKSFNELEK